MRSILTIIGLSQIVAMAIGAFSQVSFDATLINTLLQIPMIVGLIYLVLQLEDRRRLSEKTREESFIKIVDSLLGVIIELSSMANPNTITSSQIKNIEDYLKSQKRQEGRGE